VADLNKVLRCEKMPGQWKAVLTPHLWRYLISKVGSRAPSEIVVRLKLIRLEPDPTTAAEPPSPLGGFPVGWWLPSHCSDDPWKQTRTAWALVRGHSSSSCRPSGVHCWSPLRVPGAPRHFRPSVCFCSVDVNPYNRRTRAGGTADTGLVSTR